jgi:hypothetical protein
LHSDKYPPFCAKYHFSFAITPFLLPTFLGTASGQIPAPRTFAPSAFPSPPKKSTETPLKISCAPPEMQSLGLGAAAFRFWVPQKNGAEKGETTICYVE